MIQLMKNYMCMHEEACQLSDAAILKSNTCILGMFKFRGRSGDGSQMVMDYSRVGGGGSGTVSLAN